jgi:hypothetical protein
VGVRLPGKVLEHASHQVDFRRAAFRIGLASERVAGDTLDDHGFRQRAGNTTDINR